MRRLCKGKIPGQPENDWHNKEEFIQELTLASLPRKIEHSASGEPSQDQGKGVREEPHKVETSITTNSDTGKRVEHSNFSKGKVTITRRPDIQAGPVRYMSMSPRGHWVIVCFKKHKGCHLYQLLIDKNSKAQVSLYNSGLNC